MKRLKFAPGHKRQFLKGSNRCGFTRVKRLKFAPLNKHHPPNFKSIRHGSIIVRTVQHTNRLHGSYLESPQISSYLRCFFEKINLDDFHLPNHLYYLFSPSCYRISDFSLSCQRCVNFRVYICCFFFIIYRTYGNLILSVTM